MYTVAFFKTGHQLLKVHILKTDQSFFPAEKVEVCNRFRLQMPVDQRDLLIRRQDETLRRFFLSETRTEPSISDVQKPSESP